MTGRTHDLAAITALGIVVLAEPLHAMTLSTALLTVLANQIGGIAPDIDQPTAPLWRNLPIGKIVGKVTDKFLGGHRFLTHSILGLILFSALAALVLKFLHPLLLHTNELYIWWGFVIGMFSHLVMDTFTKEGVPWLLPLPVKFGFPPFKEFRVTTGKRVETFVVFPALIVLDVVLCFSHYHELQVFLHSYIS
jgi:inner membrane protein